MTGSDDPVQAVAAALRYLSSLLVNNVWESELTELAEAAIKARDEWMARTGYIPEHLRQIRTDEELDGVMVTTKYQGAPLFTLRPAVSPEEPEPADSPWWDLRRNGFPEHPAVSPEETPNG